jgi:hypothetical protein
VATNRRHGSDNTPLGPPVSPGFLIPRDQGPGP